MERLLVIIYLLHPIKNKLLTCLTKHLKKDNKEHMQTILHSDQVCQYRPQKHQHKLKANNIIQSMSRKDNCLDNAVIENLFGVLLKSELFYLKKYTSIIELSKKIKDFIKYYNNERIRFNLNGMSPIEYRAHYIKNIA